MLDAASLRTAYAAADLFVSASDFETLGNTIVESWCAGTPVAVQPKQGHLEHVVEGHNSWFVDFDDATAARAALARIVAGGLGPKALGTHLPGLAAAAEAFRAVDFASEFEAAIISPALEVGRRRRRGRCEAPTRALALLGWALLWLLLRAVTRVTYVFSREPAFKVLPDLGSSVEAKRSPRSTKEEMAEVDRHRQTRVAAAAAAGGGEDGGEGGGGDGEGGGEGGEGEGGGGCEGSDGKGSSGGGDSGSPRPGGGATGDSGTEAADGRGSNDAGGAETAEELAGARALLGPPGGSALRSSPPLERLGGHPAERGRGSFERLATTDGASPARRLRAIDLATTGTDDLATCLAEEGAAAPRPLSGGRRVASAPVQLDGLGVVVVVDDSDLT